MNLTPNQRIKLDEPVLTFFEDGDWLRIESVKGRRYLRKELAFRLLKQIEHYELPEKSEIVRV